MNITVLTPKEKTIVDTLINPFFETKFKVQLACSVGEEPDANVVLNANKMVFPSYDTLIGENDRKEILKSVGVKTSKDLKNIINNVRHLILKDGLYEDLRTSTEFGTHNKVGFRRVVPIFKTAKNRPYTTL